MLNITNHQRYANQNPNEILPYTCQNSYHQQINKQVLARMWRKGNPFALLVGMEICVATVRSYKEIPQKLKIDLPFDPAIPLLGKYPKKTNDCSFLSVIMLVLWVNRPCGHLVQKCEEQ